VEFVLSTTAFVPPFSVLADVNPQQLSLLAFKTLSHRSFVTSRFGGVTTTSTSSSDFLELKKTFYIALDSGRL
jgi:hypothetical protein